MAEVHVSEMTVQWLSTGYMLAAGITMPLAAYPTHPVKLRILFAVTMAIFWLEQLFQHLRPTSFTIDRSTN